MRNVYLVHGLGLALVSGFAGGDIKPLGETLNKLLTLRGYGFEFIPEAIDKRFALPGRQIGLLAEEVERVFPDWVAADDEGYKYVTERATTALMVEALRELRAEKDAQMAERDAQISELKQRLNKVEAYLNQGAEPSLEKNP